MLDIIVNILYDGMGVGGFSYVSHPHPVGLAKKLAPLDPGTLWKLRARYKSAQNIARALTFHLRADACCRRYDAPNTSARALLFIAIAAIIAQKPTSRWRIPHPNNEATPAGRDRAHVPGFCLCCFFYFNFRFATKLARHTERANVNYINMQRQQRPNEAKKENAG